MARPKFVLLPSRPPEAFAPLLGEAGYKRLEVAAAGAREQFEGRAIWHVSSTLRGGGVAEMLRSLLPYVRGAGVDTRWAVLREDPRFFALTKRLHNNLHGDRGDGGPLGRAEHSLYEGTLRRSAGHFEGLIHRGDVVFLHDPQTAGLARPLGAFGATVLWRCHIGVDDPGETGLRAQRFLAPDVAAADLCVFSRRGLVWPGLDPARCRVMAPSIDPFSPKNQELDRGAVTAILRAAGLTAAGGREEAPLFTRADGSPGRVERRAEVVQAGPVPEGAKLVAQVSRWDRLKDPDGLLECLATELEGAAELHLLLAGPDSDAVADDPEGALVWREVRAHRDALPAAVRARVHLAGLPMADLDENGVVVNAIQRRADVVVQKSLAEGFGLTVAEAMWKRRPVVGSRVGGIAEQIVDGHSGLLVDPRDPRALARAVLELLGDPDLVARLGAAAHDRVRRRYLGAVRLTEYAELLADLEGRR
ncbi:MAG TPA: glycosyltransferase [Solirubrobacterales bacterium]|nr:glycosyltransferase [Solirubrobacterales bacterium]